MRFQSSSLPIFSALAGIALATSAGATVIFTENFNSITGGPLGQSQNSTGLDFDANLGVTGWTAAGGNALHMIDLDATAGTNYAAQIFGGISGSLAPNTLTLNTAFAGNASGITYQVDFVADATVGAGPGAASLAADGITIDILRASDDSVLATYSNTAEHGDFFPDATQVLEADSFTYVGDGTGDVYIRLSSVRENQTSFGGVMDDLSVTAIPEPSSVALLGLGCLALVTRRKRA